MTHGVVLKIYMRAQGLPGKEIRLLPAGSSGLVDCRRCFIILFQMFHMFQLEPMSVNPSYKKIGVASGHDSLRSVVETLEHR